MTRSTASEPPSRAKLRWIVGWVLIPLTLLLLLFAAGVHVGARRPDKPLARALLWAFGGEAGVGRSDVSASGEAWRMHDFEVVVDGPADLRVDSISHRFGLTLRLDPDPEMRFAARVTVRPTCGGSCEYAEFEGRLRGKVPEHEFEQIANSKALPVERVEWVQRPTELDAGSWWWRMRSFDDSGSLVADHASVAFTDPRSNRYLHCEIDVTAPYLDRAEQLVEMCKDLEYRIVGADGPATEARFGGKYEISGFELSIPHAPAGFEFDSYSPGRRLAFHASGVGNISSFVISSGCYGHCDPATLRERAIARLEETLIDDTTQRDYQIVHSVEEVERNRWRSRVRRKEVVSGTIAAIRPGADDWIECEFMLWEEDRSRGDEFEALCLAVLADW